MLQDRQQKPVVMLDQTVYERLCEADALTDQLFLATAPAQRHVAVLTAVHSFRDAFEANRLGEDGHVEYALTEALKMMLHIAAQEARRT